MALSSWATLALNEQSEPVIDGRFVSGLGVAVEFYKNWLYVYDAKAWESGGRFVEPVVMQIWEGDIQYKDVSIGARRIALTSEHDGGVIAVISENGERMLAGVGVRGCAPDGTWVGVTQAHVDALIDHYQNEPAVPWPIDWSKAQMVNQGDLYFAKHLGVDPQASAVGDPKDPHIQKLTENLKAHRVRRTTLSEP